MLTIYRGDEVGLCDPEQLSLMIAAGWSLTKQEPAPAPEIPKEPVKEPVKPPAK